MEQTAVRVFEINPLSEWTNFVIIAIAIIVLAAFAVIDGKSRRRNTWQVRKLTPAMVAIFSIIITVMSVSALFSDIRRAYLPFKNGSCLTVTGPVEGYELSPHKGSPEIVSFNVAGVSFRYRLLDRRIINPNEDIFDGNGQMVTIGYIAEPHYDKPQIVFVDLLTGP